MAPFIHSGIGRRWVALSITRFHIWVSYQHIAEQSAINPSGFRLCTPVEASQVHLRSWLCLSLLLLPICAPTKTGLVFYAGFNAFEAAGWKVLIGALIHWAGIFLDWAAECLRALNNWLLAYFSHWYMHLVFAKNRAQHARRCGNGLKSCWPACCQARS